MTWVATVMQGNALDLSVFADDTYDVVLLLGPMYHLYSKNDKKTAISEAVRITKQSGMIFVAYCISDATIILDGFVRKSFDIFEYIENGMVEPESFATHSEPKDLFELVRKEDIDDLISGFAVTRLHYVATDGITGLIREAIDNMDEATFALYIKYHFSICERTDMAGMTHHSLDVLKKY